MTVYKPSGNLAPAFTAAAFPVFLWYSQSCKTKCCFMSATDYVCLFNEKLMHKTIVWIVVGWKEFRALSLLFPSYVYSQTLQSACFHWLWGSCCMLLQYVLDCNRFTDAFCTWPNWSQDPQLSLKIIKVLSILGWV